MSTAKPELFLPFLVENRLDYGWKPAPIGGIIWTSDGAIQPAKKDKKMKRYHMTMSEPIDRIGDDVLASCISVEHGFLGVVDSDSEMMEDFLENDDRIMSYRVEDMSV